VSHSVPLSIHFILFDSTEIEPPMGEKNKKDTTLILTQKTDANMKVKKSSKLNSVAKNFTSAQKLKFDILRRVFQKIDDDKDGFLSVEDFVKYCKSHGTYRSLAWIKQWISFKDLDEDGKLSLEEFVLSYFDVKDEHLHDNKMLLSFATIKLLFTNRDAKFILETIMEVMKNSLDSPERVDLQYLSVTNAIFPAIENLGLVTSFVEAVGFHPHHENKYLFRLIPWNIAQSDVNQALLLPFEGVLHDLFNCYSQLLDSGICELAFGKF
jgi:hypothetical protein